jgi:DNA-directed RNA polymerase specialized sigma24 family protein
LQPRHSGASLLTQVEVKRAISVLTAADWLRLHKVARALCREAAFEADDLLQEAFQRALDGTRQCTRTLDIVHFLAGVMRSIASDWRKARKRRPEMSLATETGSLQDVVLQVRDSAPVADEVLAVNEEAARLKAAIFALFVDDCLAQRLLEGIMDGLAGAQLRSLTGLSETEFASKRRLIRRRIDKAHPKDWTP